MSRWEAGGGGAVWGGGGKKVGGDDRGRRVEYEGKQSGITPEVGLGGGNKLGWGGDAGEGCWRRTALPPPFTWIASAPLPRPPPSAALPPVQVGMMQLLRSCLSKSAKESAVSIPSPVPARDTSRLRKHVGLVLERLAKGMRMALEPEDVNGGLRVLGGGGAGSVGARSRKQQQQPALVQ